MADTVKRVKFVPVPYVDMALAIRDPNSPAPMIITWGIRTAEAGQYQQEVHDQIYDRLATEMKPQLSDALHFESLTARVATGGDPLVFFKESSVAGTNTNQSTPLNCAMLIKKTTGRAGRKNRGRMYWPFAVEGAVDLRGQISQSAVNDFITKLNAFYELFQGGATDLEMLDGVYLFHSEPEGSTEHDDPTEVTSFVLDTKIATQRRRLRR